MGATQPAQTLWLFASNASSRGFARDSRPEVRDTRINRVIAPTDADFERPEPDDHLLPAGSQTPGSGDTDDAGQSNDSQLPCILIVDDDPLIRLVARESLRPAGFETAEAEGGAQGIESFERLRPDLVLLDIDMPDLDGFHVCDAIRRTAAGRHVPVLIMTALNDVVSIERAFEVGATDFASKPINWAVLAHRIRYMLRASDNYLIVRSQQVRLDEAQQLARLGSWEIDLASGSLTGSGAFRAMLALDDEQTFLDGSQVLDRVHPADRELLNKKLTDAIAQHTGFSLEHRMVGPDGSERIVHTHARMRSRADGESLGLEGFTQDITERRHSEE